MLYLVIGVAFCAVAMGSLERIIHKWDETNIKKWGQSNNKLLAFLFAESFWREDDPSDPNKGAWINKWALDDEGKPIVGIPRFPFSNNALAFLTSGYHLLKEVMWTSLSLSPALAFQDDLFDIVAVYVLFRGCITFFFYVSYGSLLSKIKDKIKSVV